MYYGTEINIHIRQVETLDREFPCIFRLIFNVFLGEKAQSFSKVATVQLIELKLESPALYWGTIKVVTFKVIALVIPTTLPLLLSRSQRSSDLQWQK